MKPCTILPSTFTYHSPLGPLTVSADNEGLRSVAFGGEAREKCAERAQGDEVPEAVREAVRWLDAYFWGNKQEILPKISLSCTAFQRIVYGELVKVPYGETVSYGELARRVAAKTGKGKMSAQAIGGAVHRNPVAIIIPCHRVVGSDGSLVGYAAGLDKKEWLLAHERPAEKNQ